MHTAVQRLELSLNSSVNKYLAGLVNLDSYYSRFGTSYEILMIRHIDFRSLNKYSNQVESGFCEGCKYKGYSTFTDESSRS